MGQIQKELKNNKKYLYYSIFISLFTILPQLLITDSIKRGLIDILLFILLVSISQYSKIIFSIFVIYFNIINIIINHIHFHWGSNFSTIEDRMRVAATSPYYETLEYLKTFIDYRDYLLIGYVLLILFLLYKFIINHKNTYKIIRIISIFISIILILILGNHQPIVFIKKYIEVSQNSKIVLARAKYLHSINSIKKPKKHSLNKQNIKYDKIIIILGESVNKHHMQIYGYNKNTTPFFSKLLRSKKLYKFNVIAPANSTRWVVGMLFTKANVSDWKNMYIHSQSIVSDFKDYGYKTYWISNQGKLDSHETYVTSIANESDNQIFFNQGIYKKAKPDIIIKTYLDKLKFNNGKEFYVFHLIGSHFSYKKRVTNDHILYKYPKNIIEEYDNTIFFTDYIIKNIFNFFTKNSQRVLIIYLSDHGEIVNPSKFGHGFYPTFKDEYEIPLLIYSNIKNKRIDLLFQKNKNHYFNMENFNYLIKYISGISNDLNISYSSKIFPSNPKVILDYDQLKFFKNN